MKDVIEYLGFDDEEKKKVGRPKLADKKTKRKSLIIAGFSFFVVTLLLVFGYGTLVGFKNFNLKGSVANINNVKNVLISEVKPLVPNITLKAGTARKVYLTVLPAGATNKVINYKSSDLTVAIVDSNGKVTGISEGNATVTASTTDGTNMTANFDIKVIKDASGNCSFSSLDKTADGIDYSVVCDNAKIKEIQYKIEDDNFEKLLTKKSNDSVPFSNEQLKKQITFKVVYYPNNSKVTKYSTKTINIKNITTTKYIDGSCSLTIKDVNSNSAKYDVTCKNASVSKIAYKIGNGSYVGLEPSSLADTILFEESDVTRAIYFNVEYTVDDNNRVKTLSKISIIESRLK